MTTADMRAEQAIHDANRERDYAVATYRAAVLSDVLPHLADVPDTAAGVGARTVLEEVLAERLVALRDALRRHGIEC